MQVAASGELEKLQRSDHDVLIRVETKMDSLTTEMRNSTVTMSNMVADHEARIRVLEKSDEKRLGDTTGALRVKNFIIVILGLVISIISVYVIYMTGVQK